MGIRNAVDFIRQFQAIRLIKQIPGALDYAPGIGAAAIAAAAKSEHVIFCVVKYGSDQIRAEKAVGSDNSKQKITGTIISRK